MAGSSRQQAAAGSKKHQDRLHREQRQTRWIIIGSIAVLIAVVGLIVFGILYENVFRGMRTVATVNGERVTVDEFRAYTKYYRYNLIRNAENTLQLLQFFGNDPNFTQQLISINGELETFRAGEKALDQMVDNILVRQEAARRNITVSSEEVETGVQEAMRYYANGAPTATPTRPLLPTSTLSPQQQTMVPPTATLQPTATPTMTVDATATAIPSPTAVESATPDFTATPAPTETPYTFEAYQDNYATLVADLSTNFEVTEATLRQVIEIGLLREKLQAEVIGEIVCEEEQVWAQHILVDDQQIAQAISQKARNGEDWQKLAAEYSKDDSNKNNSGDLGWFGQGRMVKEFEDAAFALTEPGQISDPVQSQFGWHVIRLVGRQTAPLTTTDCSRLKQTKFTDWLTELRTASAVTIDDFWQEVVPLRPTTPPEIEQAAGSLGGGLPPGFPSPTPPNTVP